jgi:hypothetical protein
VTLFFSQNFAPCSWLLFVAFAASEQSVKKIWKAQIFIFRGQRIFMILYRG